jgi:hypothetical protein
MSDRDATRLEQTSDATSDRLREADARMQVAVIAAMALAVDAIVAESERLAASLTGRQLTADDLGRLPAVRAFVEQAGAEIERYIPGLKTAIAQQQQRVAAVSIRDAVALIVASAGTDGRTATQLIAVSPPEVIQAVSQSPSQARVGRELSRLGETTRDAILAALTAWLLGGGRPEDVGALVRTKLANLLGGTGGNGVPRLGWLNGVMRTAVRGAYRTGVLRTYAANPKTVDGWIWQSKLDSRVCRACLSKHGEVYALDVPFHEHRHGRCLALPHLSGGRGVSMETGEEWLRRQSPEVQASRLGAEGARRWREGEYRLTDLLEPQADATFGAYVGHGSIERAIARAGRRSGAA